MSENVQTISPEDQATQDLREAGWTIPPGSSPIDFRNLLLLETSHGDRLFIPPPSYDPKWVKDHPVAAHALATRSARLRFRDTPPNESQLRHVSGHPVGDLYKQTFPELSGLKESDGSYLASIRHQLSYGA